MCGGVMPRKEARGLEFGVDKRSRKEGEGCAEWRWLPAELSSCIVGTLSKFLFNQYRGCLPLQLGSVRFPAELCANMEEKVNIEF